MCSSKKSLISVRAVSTPASTASSETSPREIHPWSMSGNSTTFPPVVSTAFLQCPSSPVWLSASERRLPQPVHRGFLVAAKDGRFENRGGVAPDGAVKVDVAGGRRLGEQPRSETVSDHPERAFVAVVVLLLFLRAGDGRLDAGSRRVVGIRLDPRDAAVGGKGVESQKVPVPGCFDGLVVGLVAEDPGEAHVVSHVGKGVGDGSDAVAGPDLREQIADAEAKQSGRSPCPSTGRLTISPLGEGASSLLSSSLPVVRRSWGQDPGGQQAGAMVLVLVPMNERTN
mmetsp:Transcript_20326/g.42351  ORF Transcript_20326/g.42351 Transcript_20326/m.42351 type:complete len:284 (-) Transcript_20326:38-889(-)